MLATHYDIVSTGSVLSTQDVASESLAASGNATLVVATHQTRGRGRHGRVWDEPARAMFSSFSFTTTWPEDERAVITLCTAVALAEAIEESTGTRCDVKWPNDLLVAGSKVAGILVESSGDVVTVGCGANLWWPDAPSYAGALFEDDPGGAVALDLATGWVDRLLTHIAGGPGSWPRDSYIEWSWTLGRSVEWDGGSGRAAGIADGGGLLVETANGIELITAGEVHMRGGTLDSPSRTKRGSRDGSNR